MNQWLMIMVGIRRLNSNQRHSIEAHLHRPAGTGQQWKLELTIKGDSSDNFEFKKALRPIMLTGKSVNEVKQQALTLITRAASNFLMAPPDNIALAHSNQWIDASD